MRYSVMPWPNNSNIWTIFDDRDEVIFSGLYEQCEEWLDLADLRDVVRGQSSIPATESVTIRRPVFERAAELLNRFWSDCAGEVRVSGEPSAIILMIVVVVCLATHFVWPVTAQQASLLSGASSVTYGVPHWATCSGTHTEASCASARTLDMACDAVDD